MDASGQDERLDAPATVSDGLSLQDFVDCEWSAAGVGPELEDPALLQRVERAVLQAGARQRYFDHHEIIWREISDLRPVCRDRFVDQQGRPYSAFDELRLAAVAALEPIVKRRRELNNVHLHLLGASALPRPDERRRLNALAEQQAPIPPDLAEDPAVVQRAERAFEEALQSSVAEGRILAVRRTGGAWELLSPSEAGRIVFARRRPKTWELRVLLSGELPATLQVPGKGGPAGRLRKRVTRHVRDSIAAHSEQKPWPTKAQAIADWRARFPALSATMAKEIWKETASEAMKGPGRRARTSEP